MAPKAYFLNTTPGPLVMILNSGQAVTLAAWGKPGCTWSYPFAPGTAADQLGTANKIYVQGSGMQAQWSVTVDTTVVTLTRDVQFLMFLDTLTGRQDVTLDGFSITRSDAQ